MASCLRTFRNRDGFCVLAVDGSRVECAHTLANEDGLGCAGRDKTAPQVFVTTLWHAGFALPWDFRTGPGTDSERCHLDQMLDGLPEKTFLLADAGFVSFGLCHALQQQGHSFLLRVGSNVHLLTDLEYEYEQRDDIVYLWPRKQRRLPPLKLRLIRLPDEKGQTVYLLTDILDTQRLPDKQAQRLYASALGSRGVLPIIETDASASPSAQPHSANVFGRSRVGPRGNLAAGLDDGASTNAPRT